MGHVKHTVNKKVIFGNVKDFQDAAKENQLLVVAIAFSVGIILYFMYALNKMDILLDAAGTKGNITNQFFLLLPHLILLGVLGTPIVRKFLLWIKFTPFYLRRDQVRSMRPKAYNKIRYKRFAIYFAVSFLFFLVAMFYIFIL